MLFHSERGFFNCDSKSQLIVPIKSIVLLSQVVMDGVASEQQQKTGNSKKKSISNQNVNLKRFHQSFTNKNIKNIHLRLLRHSRMPTQSTSLADSSISKKHFVNGTTLWKYKENYSRTRRKHWLEQKERKEKPLPELCVKHGSSHVPSLKRFWLNTIKK